MTVYTQVFGGANIYPSELSYRDVSLTISTVLEWPLETAASNEVVARIMDVNPVSSGLTITMPDATEASTGETVLFNNIGSNTFTVLDSTGGTICAPQSGTTFQIYLTNNSTAAGTWRAFQYGASVSSTNAAALAGLGIKAIATTLNQSAPVSSFNSNYTANTSDRASVYVWTGGAGTLSLTAAATMGNDWFVMVRNGGTGNLTVDPAGSETINGASTLTMHRVIVPSLSVTALSFIPSALAKMQCMPSRISPLILLEAGITRLAQLSKTKRSTILREL